MNNQVSASNLPVILHNQLPVITSELLAQLYGTEPDYIRKNHNRNINRFVEGKHFFKVVGDELKKFKALKVLKTLSQNARHLILWTERGAARHAKMLETDQAWEVFERLEDCYFNQHQPKPVQKIPEPPCRFLINLAHDGQQSISIVPDDACVMPAREILENVAAGKIYVPYAELSEFVIAATKQLSRQFEYCRNKAKPVPTPSGR